MNLPRCVADRARRFPAPSGVLPIGSRSVPVAAGSRTGSRFARPAEAAAYSLPIRGGKITNASVELGELDITQRDVPSIVHAGVAQVMEGRRILAALTVDENLRAGAFTCRSRREGSERRDEMLELFPALARYLRQTAGLLSAGEQQMLAIARALIARPRLLLLDEPSHGLAPRTVARLRDIIVAVNRRGSSANCRTASSVCPRGSRGLPLLVRRALELGTLEDWLDAVAVGSGGRRPAFGARQIGRRGSAKRCVSAVKRAFAVSAASAG